MPCIKCISSELRELLLSDSPSEFIKTIEDIDVCGDDSLIEFEKKGKNGKKKREPSEYNKFVGVCMKEGNGMKDCAGKWKKKK